MQIVVDIVNFEKKKPTTTYKERYNKTKKIHVDIAKKIKRFNVTQNFEIESVKPNLNNDLITC